MKDDWYITRACLRTDANVSALAPLLTGKAGGFSSVHGGHHLVWSMFASEESMKRQFLWREFADGQFMVLSPVAPPIESSVLLIDTPKVFTPKLRAGQRLQFTLRVNPVVRIRDLDTKNGSSKKHDIVMHALFNKSISDRARERRAIIQEAGFDWLVRQSYRSGFTIQKEWIRIDGYQKHTVPRNSKQRPIVFSSLDYDGVLEVNSPDIFLSRIKEGFGSAKSFGCGLMLIRRP